MLIDSHYAGMSSKFIQLLPLQDPLGSPSTSSFSIHPGQITSLHFLSPGSFRSSPSSHLLWTTTASSSSSSPDQPLTSTQQGWQISHQPFELSDAFSNLEGKKKSPPAPGDQSLGYEWVVVAAESRATDAQQGRLVVQQLQASDGILYSLSISREEGYTLAGQDCFDLERDSSASIPIPSRGKRFSL